MHHVMFVHVYRGQTKLLSIVDNHVMFYPLVPVYRGLEIQIQTQILSVHDFGERKLVAVRD